MARPRGHDAPDHIAFEQPIGLVLGQILAEPIAIRQLQKLKFTYLEDVRRIRDDATLGIFEFLLIRVQEGLPQVHGESPM
jgi:hypothetical protein